MKKVLLACFILPFIQVSATPYVGYIAIGDSITEGIMRDDIPADGIGYEPILGTLLTNLKGYPIIVVKEGVSGVKSAYGAANISSTLSKYPSVQYYLVQYGTNDARVHGPPVPSGLGLIPGDAGYIGSYKNNMQKIISAIKGVGKTPYLAKVPYCSVSICSDPDIQKYNAVIDELVVANGILIIPPNFYSHFKTHPGELADGVHPNGVGYQSMANLWFSALN
jgi:lysophospholipase L1-like esterase